MIRSSKHILKYQTKYKSSMIDNIFEDYKADLEFYIDLILSDQLPLKKFLSTKDLPTNIIKHSTWKQIIYKHASEIIRSQIKKASNKRFKHYQFIYAKCKEQNRRLNFLSKKFSELNLKSIHQTKYFTKPNIENISIILNENLFDFKDGDYFDEFIRIKSPYFHTPKKRAVAITFNLPIKHHKQSNKFNDWDRKKSIQLSNINGNYYITLFYEKTDKELKTSGNILGIDQGYKKLLTCSNGEIFGQDNFQTVYDKLNRKHQGSKGFKRALTERDNLINQCCNQLNLSPVRELVVEDLKNVKHKTKGKISHKFMNKLQRWSYLKTSDKLERLCEENGILLTKVNPAYTSQKCSVCGCIDKKSRSKERYSCQHCGYINDADINAAINISHMGIYRSHNPKNISS